MNELIKSQVKVNSTNFDVTHEELLPQIQKIKTSLTVIYGGSQLVVHQLKKALEMFDVVKYVIPRDFLDNLELIHEEALKGKKIIQKIDFLSSDNQNSEY